MFTQLLACWLTRLIIGFVTSRSGVRLSARYHDVVVLGKLFTPICPCHQRKLVSGWGLPKWRSAPISLGHVDRERLDFYLINYAILVTLVIVSKKRKNLISLQVTGRRHERHASVYPSRRSRAACAVSLRWLHRPTDVDVGQDSTPS